MIGWLDSQYLYDRPCPVPTVLSFFARLATRRWQPLKLWVWRSCTLATWDPELKKMLNIKDAKQDKEKKAPKENAWEVASKVGDEDNVGSIKSKVLKFKAELIKDAATVELKAHELKSQNPAEKIMVKDSLKAADHGQKTCEKLDKMAKGKCARSEATKLLQVAYTALTDLKAAKVKLMKALKAE